jgi:hypothetical protein
MAGAASLLRTLLEPIFPQLRWRERVRAVWGVPGQADSAHADRYFELLQAGRRAAPAVVDDTTWNHLELRRLFRDMDTTLTPFGRQCLLRQLRTYEPDPTEIERRHVSYQVLASDAELREALQKRLLPLEQAPAGYVLDLLLGRPLPLPARHELVVPWVLVTLLAAVAAGLQLVTVWLPVALFAVNAVISFRLDRQLSQGAEALLCCSQMLKAAGRLAALRSRGRLPLLDPIAAEARVRLQLWRQVRWLTVIQWLRNQGSVDPSNPINVIGGVVGVLNILFLVKLMVYVQAIARFTGSREQWLAIFEQIGSVDAAIAVAGFLLRHPAHCRAVVTEQPRIELVNGYHPLIGAPVKCSLVLDGRSALVTGSNMTGKTTFIKMTAINVILGGTLGFCLADRALVPRVAVRALIRADQSVESGKSRYFAEAEAMCGFLHEAQAGGRCLFVIDEPFSGTNVVERIAVAKSVLRALASAGQVLVTTHDVELQRLLGEGFDLYHFREDPAVEGFFDYQLRNGASSERNAIRVLQRLGLPEAVVAEALATAAALRP